MIIMMNQIQIMEILKGDNSVSQTSMRSLDKQINITQKRVKQLEILATLNNK